MRKCSRNKVTKTESQRKSHGSPPSLQGGSQGWEEKKKKKRTAASKKRQKTKAAAAGGVNKVKEEKIPNGVRWAVNDVAGRKISKDNVYRRKIRAGASFLKEGGKTLFDL